MSGGLLQASDVSSGYGDVTALWGVTASVPAGGLCGIVGANGAGKTTLLRTIAGLNPVLSGAIHFDGEDVAKMQSHKRIRRGIALVPEGKRVFKRLSVEDNLLLGGYSVTKRRAQLAMMIDKALQRFPVLAARRRDPAGALSGGQQQMLAIAQAIVPEPRLLMLDEPSAGLAPSILSDVLETVTALRDDGMAVILVEQAIDLVMSVAERLIVLDLGKVVLDQPTAEIADLTIVRQAYFGTHGKATS